MRSSLILVFFLFGLALCAPKFYSSELEGLSDVQQQQQQQQQEQPQQQGDEKVQLEEAERRRLSERLGRRFESDEPTPRQEAIVILRPTVAARQTAARFAVRRVKLVPIPVVAVPDQQQQQQESSEEETTPEPTTPSTTTEEETTANTTTEETTSSTEEPSTTEETNTAAADEEQRPKFASDASAVVNSRTFTTYKARKNVNGKQVTVMGRSMALRSSFMNVLRPVVAQKKENETDEEREQREKAEADAKNVKIVQFSQMQAIRSSKAVITRDLPTNF